MKITLTKQQFKAQLQNLDWRFQSQEVINQCVADWESLTKGADTATLFVRGLHQSFDCHMATPEEAGFFNTYLPISETFLNGF
jgi:hypothetical protein